MMGYYDTCVIGYYSIWVIRACANFIRVRDVFLAAAGYYRKL